MIPTDAEIRAMHSRVQWLQEAAKEIRAAGANETWAKVCDQGALDLAVALGRLGFANSTAENLPLGAYNYRVSLCPDCGDIEVDGTIDHLQGCRKKA
jgi:hypothetical protein